MKNKSTGTGDRKRKGFYAALAAGVGAVMVLALVISFSDLMSGPDPQQYAYDQINDEPDTYGEAVLAGYDHTQPYMAQADLDQALFRPRTSPAPETPQDTPAVAPADPQTVPEQPAAAPPDEPAAAIPQEAPASPEAAPAPEPGATTENEPTPAPETAPAQPAPDQTAFAPFEANDQLLWPVYGDIAMDFSQDRLIYNPTLDQWRTNDDLRISAQEGTPVRAAAAGRVSEVGTDRVYGNFVRIDNGNGWETIFGQLMDGILVVEGDIVEAGQVIGGVGRPSVFSVLNGHHVSLRVLHEEALMDPKQLLAEITE